MVVMKEKLRARIRMAPARGEHPAGTAARRASYQISPRTARRTQRTGALRRAQNRKRGTPGADPAKGSPSAMHAENKCFSISRHR
ncbi:protein of unknown function [Azospirillum baldaniorum]|uniref:Uncharacterized protein n=1 Tax=Azospirillum baldaniorum TaxID=1064539 RepID=A0A9P1JRN7_9PROT|nr:protein of unknown function [Azospirillum baldaniorum]